MYQGYLDSFHHKNQASDNYSYNDYFNLILNDATEFAVSYNKNFRKLGVDASFVISNDLILQNKWLKERSLKPGSAQEIITEQVRAMKPEVLWIEDFGSISRQWIADIKREVSSIRLVVAYHCAPYSQSVLEKLQTVDFVFTCTPGIKKDLESKGIRTYLIYHAFDSDFLSRLTDNKNVPRNNVIFSGSLFPGNDYHNDRIAFIERLINEKLPLSLYVNLEKSYKIYLKKTIYLLSETLKKLKLQSLTENISVFEYGRSPIRNYSENLKKSNHPPLFGIDMYNLFDMSDAVLNMHVGVAGNYAGNMRMFEVTGVGSCLLTDNKKNLGDLFETGKEILVYDNVEDCIEKIKWLTYHENERKSIASAGQKRTLTHHTVENRSRQIIDIISGELKKA
jgi:spore maturation protein CgeB